MSDSKKPVAEVRIGKVKAAIWANEREQRTDYNVTLTRVYRKDDEWRNTTSYGRDDLLVLEKVVSAAYAKVQELIDADRQARSGGNGSGGQDGAKEGEEPAREAA